MTNHLHAASMQFVVEPREPIAALAVAAHGKIRGVTTAIRRVRQAPEMRPVEANLRDLGLHVIHERQIAGVRVTRPMSDEAGELKRLKGWVRTFFRPWNFRFTQVLSLASSDE